MKKFRVQRDFFLAKSGVGMPPPQCYGAGINERNNKIVKIGVTRNQIKDLARWYFLKNLTIEIIAIVKAAKKKAIVPKNEARVACFVAGSVVSVIKNVSATIDTRRAIFPHLNTRDLLYFSII